MHDSVIRGARLEGCEIPDPVVPHGHLLVDLGTRVISFPCVWTVLAAAFILSALVEIDAISITRDATEWVQCFPPACLLEISHVCANFSHVIAVVEQDHKPLRPKINDLVWDSDSVGLA